jgi:hypothetical protein
VYLELSTLSGSDIHIKQKGRPRGRPFLVFKIVLPYAILDTDIIPVLQLTTILLTSGVKLVYNVRMSDKLSIYCDLCGEQIYKRGNGNAIIISGGTCQVWPTENGNIDVCPSCCKILMKAKQIGIIDYDEMPLFLRAGFKKIDDIWNGPSFVEMFGDQVE